VSDRSGVSRGDRNRNARLARLREAVPLTNAIAGIDLADSKQMVVVTDHESRVLARRAFRRRAWELGVALDWAAARAAAAGFAGVTVAVEPTGHRWRVVGQLAAERGMAFVCVQPLMSAWARRAEDLTFDKTDDKDAVLIARLAAQLRCYLPEPADELWGRLRHLGVRRARLVAEQTAQMQQMRDLLECAWPAVLDAARQPFKSTTWHAALTVALARAADGDLSRVSRLGQQRFDVAVRRQVARWGAVHPWRKNHRRCLRWLRRPGRGDCAAPWRAGTGRAAAGRLARHPGPPGRHRDPHDRRPRRTRAGHWPPRSPACPRSAQLPSLPRPATRHGSPPAARWSSTPASHPGRRTPATPPAAPAPAGKDAPHCAWRPGERSGAR
jgi:transposase